MKLWSHLTDLLWLQHIPDNNIYIVISVLRAKFCYHWLHWDSNQFWDNVLWVCLGDSSSIFCGKPFRTANLPWLMICSTGWRWMQDQILPDKYWGLYQEDTICMWVGVLCFHSLFLIFQLIEDYSVKTGPFFMSWKLRCYSIYWSIIFCLYKIFLMENTKTAKNENAKTYFCILTT